MEALESKRKETINLKRIVEKLQGEGVNAQICKRSKLLLPRYRIYK